MKRSQELKQLEGLTEIKLRAVFGKQQGGIDLSPVRQGSTGKLLGVDTLSDEERKKVVRPVDGTTTRKVTDGMVLNLKDETDATDWKWLLHNPSIALSFEDAQMTPSALFYVENEEAEIKKEIDLDDLLYDAMTIVKENTLSQNRELLRLMGLNTEHWREIEIDNHLRTLAKKDPARLIRIANDPDKKHKLLLSKLIDQRIVVHEDGVYKYGTVTLGTTESATVFWLKDTENKSLLNAMYRDLNELAPDANAPAKDVAEAKEAKEAAKTKSTKSKKEVE